MNTGTPMPLKALRHDLQGDRLAGAGRAGDQAVPVGERRQERELDGRCFWQWAGVRAWRWFLSNGSRYYLGLRFVAPVPEVGTSNPTIFLL